MVPAAPRPPLQATRDPWLRCSHLFQPLTGPKVAPPRSPCRAAQTLWYHWLRVLSRVWVRAPFGAFSLPPVKTAGPAPESQQKLGYHAPSIRETGSFARI